MFKIPYLRSYPWFLQLFLFIMLLFIIATASTLIITQFLPVLTGYTFVAAATVTETSSYAQVKAGLLAQGIVHASVFLIPCLLFAYFAHPRPAYYLGLRKPGKSSHWLLVVGITIGAMPVLMAIVSILQSMHWGKWADDAQQKIESIEKAFFNMPSFSAFVAVFFVMAILPAVGEELMFRGVLMRFVKKRSKGMVFPIVVSALMFALVHFSAYGFIPIFMSGLLLGFIYYATGSLWCSMLFHLLNNGLQVLLAYMGKSNPTVNAMLNDNSIPAYYPIAGLILCSVCLYLLWKNRTPLPPDWANDFSKEELEAERQIVN